MRPRQVSDDEILAAARECFLEHGPAVSTTVIADRLGVSQAALFKRFGKKDDLMIAALAPPHQLPWVERAEGGPHADAPIRDQLRELLGVVYGFLRDFVPCLTVLRSSHVSLEDLFSRYDVPPPIRSQLALAAWIRKAAASGRIRDVEPFTAAQATLGALHGRAFLSHLAGDAFARLGGDDEAYLDNLTELLWRGLAPQQEAL